ncbi:hypothetical protein PC9H_011459 [Pleurotus ostreatus]|uniref:Uncharacterized protein n=1 Tax=Pleurotus ostreatus TaxID=5322 RepID=A0A8H7DLH3_PLEOS|nr:uncharacterized protein PC9H_011450 [Pleurotus ostreatus]XP_036626798.1 uncharacterized protein PC9H_011459 [Pleurotus ostreatus]KAF7420931.1 hypothetical protein PC9H_011450 [Pleurotus ostreatus]KAF7420940.1 hypothetical protein PC9H_011459 [Pleurotus ostreatus]
MGRPRKYTTEESRLDAIRANRKRHYERHRETVLQQRRQRYHEDKRLNGKQSLRRVVNIAKENSGKPARITKKASNTHDVSSALHDLEHELREIVHPSEAEYATQIYTEAMVDNTATTIDRELDILEILAQKAQVETKRIWEKEGCVPEFEASQRFCRRVRDTIMILEDMLEYALSSVDELSEAYEQCKLMFQNM